jgi:diguanylate cyclase (GGDEF)-like protein
MPASRLFGEDEWAHARLALSGDLPVRDRIWQQRRADGGALESILFTRDTGFANAGQDGGSAGTIVCVFDVTERRQAEAKMAHMARHDALTGLANRTQCREALGALLRDGGGAVGLLVVDLDHFKIVNDTYGHLVGDMLLEHVAARMVATAPTGSLAARLGGDEFAVVLPAGLAMPEIISAAVGIVAAMREPFVIEDHRLLIGATVGVAAAPVHAGDAETLIRFADLALYSAKAEQRGTVVLFDPDMDTAARERHRLENDLREAIRTGGLEVHYQPLIDLQTGVTQGYEALVRWNHPTRGLIGPDHFIPLAEETGLIDLIGQFVLNTACAEAATWTNEETLAVNVSPVQFRNANLLRVVTQALAASQLPPARLEIELTEAVLIEKSPQVAATMASLRTLGVGISMDDFGTGYSSLSYLLSYPFTKIKIDKSFVSSLDTKPNSQAIVKAIIGLGGSLGMTVTAEGIEQGSVLDYLKSQGCGQGQGYLFGEARPAGELPLQTSRTKAA